MSRSPAATSSTSPDLPRVGAFLAIALAVTLALSAPVATGLLPPATVVLLVPLAQLSPLLAALVVRRRQEPWWRELGLGVPSWKLLGIATLGAVAAFSLVPLARVLIGLGAGAAPMADAIPVLGLAAAVPAVFVMQAAFAIGEEAGWRGWLHRELAPLGFWVTSLIIGVMWALWHLPIVLALGLAPREAVTYLGTIVAVAPLLSALREISGTAWAAVIGHGLFNSVRVAIEQNVLDPVGPGVAWVLDLSSWVLWIAVAWMVLRVAGGVAPGPGNDGSSGAGADADVDSGADGDTNAGADADADAGAGGDADAEHPARPADAGAALRRALPGAHDRRAGLSVRAAGA
ncbi:type II CAAX endopeptidase family protein [Brachybacterium sp. FME24]|uniref:type II CAAX endopeptidase family protein n=1 Tax=Brachybacterium sp. FME24 TaxID=2742605 RepID=UPI001D04DFAA|nr:type II CAAX endopeptidase family protein [Brachybacterium sp. FME24]